MSTIVAAVDDEKVVSQLSRLTVKSGHKDMRQRALQLLKKAFTGKSMFISSHHADLYLVSHLQHPIKESLQEVIELSLKDRKSCANALDVIDILAGDHTIGMHTITSLF
jgi:hypothetical protein